MGVGSEVDQLLTLFFTAFIYHAPLGSFYFLQCFRSSEISFIAPTLGTSISSDTFPFFSLQLCLQLSSLVSSHMSIPTLPFCFPCHTWRLFDISMGKLEHGSALRCGCTMHRMAAQGTRGKEQPQAAPSALGRGFTALEIQKLILGQIKVPHEGKQCLHNTRWLWLETGLRPSRGRIPLYCTNTEGNWKCF